jgi:esterase
MMILFIILTLLLHCNQSFRFLTPVNAAAAYNDGRYLLKSGKTLYHSSVEHGSLAKQETVVILHGLLGSSRNFQSWSRFLNAELNREKQIICLDLRNHGKSSDQGSLPMDYESMAKDVIQTLHSLKISQCHLVGHSLGGKVAAAASLLSPEEYKGKIHSTTMIDISPVEYSPEDFESVIGCIHILSKIDQEYLIKPDITRAELNAIISSQFASFDPMMIPFIQSSLITKEDHHTRGGGSYFTWSFQLHGIMNSMDEILSFPFRNDPEEEEQSRSGPSSAIFPSTSSSSTLPLLILKGSESKFVRSSHLPRISRLFPNYSLVSVKNASHWVHVDQPEKSASAVADFIRLHSSNR